MARRARPPAAGAALLARSNRNFMQRLFVERALFVVGGRNSGKSTQLRSMFSDLRFGTGGEIPTSRKAREILPLSTDRALYLRLTSPHERGESLKEFFAKVVKKSSSGRWCFAAPLQPDAAGRMPGVVETVKAFRRRFAPDRVRVCLLSPDRHGNRDERQDRIGSALLSLDGVEFLCIDARFRLENGSVLADFFDFS